MKKLIMKKFTWDQHGDDKLFGVEEKIRWKKTDYCRGPREKGHYLTSDGKGNIQKYYYTGTNESGIELIQEYLHGNTLMWSDGKDMTDSEILDLGRRYGIWYDFTNADCYNEWHDEIEILRDEDIPRYYLDIDIRGPIDEELDSYEEEFYEKCDYEHPITSQKEGS